MRKREAHLTELKSVPVARDKYENRLVCSKCGRKFRRSETVETLLKDCPAPKYFTPINYKEPAP
jgi:predicted amidophosphoribosyltransferase